MSSTNLVWDSAWDGSAYNVEYFNGTSYVPVPSPTAPTLYGAYGGAAATEIKFDPIYAQFLRITNVTGTVGYSLLNQLLSYGPDDGTLTSSPGNGGTVSLTGGPQSITLTNTGGVGTAIAITGYSITGLDAGQFSLTNYAEEILTSGLDASFIFNVALTGPLSAQTYNALLTFTTSAGNVSFNLTAAGIPEPSCALLLSGGLFGIGLIRRRRRHAQCTH